MGRKSVFETHKDGPTTLAALLAGSISQAQAAKDLGVTGSAISQYMKRRQTEVQQAAQAMIQASAQAARESGVEQQAIDKVDELHLLETNVLRMEEIQAPLHDTLRAILKDLKPETFSLLPPQTLGVIGLLRSLFDASGRLLMNLLKAREDLRPAEDREREARKDAQIQRQNAFILQNHPELLDEYQSYLQGGED